tara:strand:+ start:2888 stop:4096 length:1209 start_codon:yes stop_codon:yes gene_type:complete
MKTFISRLNYFYIAFTLFWVPLQQTVLAIDGLGRIPIVITIFVFVINYLLDKNFKFLIISNPFLFWGIWIIYSIINLFLKGYLGEIPLFYFFGLKLLIPFVVMLITAKEAMRSPAKVTKYLLYMFLLYALFYFFMLTGDMNFSKTGHRSFNLIGNIGTLTVIYVMFFASILYITKKLSLTKLIMMIIFTLLIVVLTATRKAFGASLIMIVMLIFSQFKLKPKNVFIICLLGIGLNFAVDVILENTLLGARFDLGVADGEERNTTDFKALRLLGDRAFFYISAWEVFVNNLYTGVGLGNFRHETNTRLLLHSEYLVHLAEGGILGTSLFLAFNMWFGKNLLRARKNLKYRPLIYVMIGAFISILFINLTAWTYEFGHYFIVFGLMSAYIKRSNNSMPRKPLSR